MKGKLRFFNREKGWGLIEPDGIGRDIFMPVSKVVVGEPHKGARCVFDVTEERGKGPVAVNVRLGAWAED